MSNPLISCYFVHYRSLLLPSPIVWSSIWLLSVLVNEIIIIIWGASKKIDFFMKWIFSTVFLNFSCWIIPCLMLNLKWFHLARFMFTFVSDRIVYLKNTTNLEKLYLVICFLFQPEKIGMLCNLIVDLACIKYFAKSSPFHSLIFSLDISQYFIHLEKQS